MCWCNPNLRTPCCGGVDCYPPQVQPSKNEVEFLSLIDFCDVWETSVEVGDCRHLWDWLNYNGYIKPQTEECE